MDPNERILDILFSQLRRLEEADVNNRVTCISCGVELDWKGAQAGHYNSRRHMLSRWLSKNVWPQCNHCNVELNGNMPAYREALVERYGEEEVLNLENLKNRTVNWSAREIGTMLDDCRKKLNKIKKEKL